MSNSISFVGRLGKDPELKTVGQSQVLEFSIVNETGFGDRKVSSWYVAKYWGNRGASVQQYLSKGSQIFISGELTLRKYTNKEGVEKMSPEINIHSIDFVGGKKDSDTVPPAGPEDTESGMPF